MQDLNQSESVFFETSIWQVARFTSAMSFSQLTTHLFVFLGGWSTHNTLLKAAPRHKMISLSPQLHYWACKRLKVDLQVLENIIWNG